MLKSTLVACIIFLSSYAPARVHRDRPHEHKTFAANHESVLLENLAADEMGAVKFATQDEVDTAVASGQLVPFFSSYRTYVVSPKLPRNRRFALPSTVSFITKLSVEFYREFEEPLIIDSAVRPATTQRRLMRFNRNAAPAFGDRASTHERGCTTDLNKRMTKQEYRWLVLRLLYYRAIGRVLVIEESKCWHIMVLPESFVSVVAVLPLPTALSMDTTTVI